MKTYSLPDHPRASFELADVVRVFSVFCFKCATHSRLSNMRNWLEEEADKQRRNSLFCISNAQFLQSLICIFSAYCDNRWLQFRLSIFLLLTAHFLICWLDHRMCRPSSLSRNMCVRAWGSSSARTLNSFMFPKGFSQSLISSTAKKRFEFIFIEIFFLFILVWFE